MKCFLILLLITGSVAASNCPTYQYHDYVWSSNYPQPQRPPDTLINDCPNLNLSTPGACTEIQNSSLTNQQQKQIILDGLVYDNGQPPLSEAENWNNAVNFTNYPPDGTNPVSSGNIENAWVNLFSVSPSVTNSTTGQVWVNDTQTLQLAYNFSFVVPQQSFPGDCQTNYAVCGYDYQLQALDDGQNLIESAPGYFQGNSFVGENNLTAILSVESEYQIDHYQTQRHCQNFLGSIYCWNTCNYASTEDHKSSLTITDNSTAYLQGNRESGSVFVDSFQNGILNGWLQASSTNTPASIFLQVGNSQLSLQLKQYQLNYSSAPYNALEPIDLDANGQLQNGISVLSENTSSNPYELTLHFLARTDSLNCTLEINSDFTDSVIPNACNYSANQQPVINLTVTTPVNSSFDANAWFYDNATGQPFAGKTIVFTYSNLTLENQTNLQGFASVSFNYTPQSSLVTASFQTDFQVKSASATAIVGSDSSFPAGFWYWVGLAAGVWFFWLLGRRFAS